MNIKHAQSHDSKFKFPRVQISDSDQGHKYYKKWIFHTPTITSYQSPLLTSPLFYLDNSVYVIKK